MILNSLARTPAIARIVLSAWLLAAVLLAPFPAPLRAEQPAKAEQVSTEPFDEVWRLVRDRFYDLKLHGLDWAAIGDTYRPRYAAAASPTERSSVINAMLSELKASHTRHYINDDPGYYQLAEIFSYPLRGEIPKHFPSNKVIYPGIGIFTKAIEGKTFVYGVMAGLPGDKAGLLTGDEIVSADGKAFARSARSKAKPERLCRSKSAAALMPKRGASLSCPKPSSREKLSRPRCAIVRASSSAMARKSATSVSGPMPEAAIKTCSKKS